ncbi:MAG: prevent-host-death protein [Proteobacteria bacterium]|nr:prevent-host-death protein [Pseudomonadota bacterium]
MSFSAGAWVPNTETLQLPVWEFKTRFSEALEIVSRGGSVCITYGRSRKPVALFSPPPRPAGKRKLGTLAGKVKFHISKDWSLAPEEFVNP